jgi:hypothetical protein
MSDGKTSGGTFEGYKNGQDVPLLSYGVLAGTFNLLFALFLLAVRASGKSIPERMDAKDIALLGSQDAITSPLRAPFTELNEKESPKKVDEKPRGGGIRRSVGELITCQFCLGVWVASFFTYGFVLLPRVSRLIAAVFAAVTVSDFLHQVYKALMKSA